jgi:hypothetical protein
MENRDLEAMMTFPSSALEELWNNDTDSIYDEI